jgi:hypothetical protein
MDAISRVYGPMRPADLVIAPGARTPRDVALGQEVVVVLVAVGAVVGGVERAGGEIGGHRHQGLIRLRGALGEQCRGPVGEVVT